MLEPIVSYFEKLVTDFSWRRLLLVLIVVGSAITGVWIYETYTGTFELSRIERELALVEHLSKVSKDIGVSETEGVKRALEGVEAKVEASIYRSASPVALDARAKQALAATIAWAILAVFIAMFGTKTSGFATTLAGMVVVAVPCIALAALLPQFSASWINYWLYPIGQLLLSITALMVWQKRKAG